MVVPAEIANAAARGDSARVLAWLDADVSEPRDINDVDETGKTLLYSSTGASKRMHYRHLALVRELINRGADVNKRGSATVGLLTYGLVAHDLSKVGDMDKYSKRLYVFVLMLLLAGFDPNQREVFRLNASEQVPPSAPLLTALIALKQHPTRHFVKICSVLLRAGASLDYIVNGKSVEVTMQAIPITTSTIRAGPIILAVGVPGLVDHPSWVAWTKLVGEVRAAGGTWTAYRRQSRKGVLRLRSLVLRGRARSRRRATGAADPVIGRVLSLPNELCWHVLQFWRATSDAIGEPEVI